MDFEELNPIHSEGGSSKKKKGKGLDFFKSKIGFFVGGTAIIAVFLLLRRGTSGSDSQEETTSGTVPTGYSGYPTMSTDTSYDSNSLSSVLDGMTNDINRTFNQYQAEQNAKLAQIQADNTSKISDLTAQINSLQTTKDSTSNVSYFQGSGANVSPSYASMQSLSVPKVSVDSGSKLFPTLGVASNVVIEQAKETVRGQVGSINDMKNFSKELTYEKPVVSPVHELQSAPVKVATSNTLTPNPQPSSSTSNVKAGTGTLSGGTKQGTGTLSKPSAVQNTLTKSETTKKPSAFQNVNTPIFGGATNTVSSVSKEITKASSSSSSKKKK